MLSVFGKILLISCIIGIPVAIYLSGRWLQSFEYRTDLSVCVFAGAVAAIAVITMLSVGYESLRASMANPVKALHSE
ncbi:MAG: hypothetical protein SH848_18805 [Saprospiraceae bacterium]|nr:hypothetical protein [Saprospiraceae bacterium]MDZ4705984.1 hypothetical protein [Saprospiraceae bacterium]